MELTNREYTFDIVGKIGSMALIRKEDNDIDYNIFAKLGAQLKPGMIWISSGATEIGRLDYIKRNGQELSGDIDENKTDYSAQGQAKKPALSGTTVIIGSGKYTLEQLVNETVPSTRISLC